VYTGSVMPTVKRRTARRRAAHSHRMCSRMRCIALPRGAASGVKEPQESRAAYPKGTSEKT